MQSRDRAVEEKRSEANKKNKNWKKNKFIGGGRDEALRRKTGWPTATTTSSPEG